MGFVLLWWAAIWALALYTTISDRPRKLPQAVQAHQDALMSAIRREAAQAVHAAVVGKST
jgi:hypothetical protein